jgi:hypothetical protein
MKSIELSAAPRRFHWRVFALVFYSSTYSSTELTVDQCSLSLFGRRRVVVEARRLRLKRGGWAGRSPLRCRSGCGGGCLCDVSTTIVSARLLLQQQWKSRTHHRVRRCGSRGFWLAAPRAQCTAPPCGHGASRTGLSFSVSVASWEPGGRDSAPPCPVVRSFSAFVVVE